MALEALFNAIGTVISSVIFFVIANHFGIDSPWIAIPIAAIPVYGLAYKMIEYKHLFESMASTADKLAISNREKDNTITMLNNAINNSNND